MNIPTLKKKKVIKHFVYKSLALTINFIYIIHEKKLNNYFIFLPLVNLFDG